MIDETVPLVLYASVVSSRSKEGRHRHIRSPREHTVRQRLIADRPDCAIVYSFEEKEWYKASDHINSRRVMKRTEG